MATPKGNNPPGPFAPYDNMINENDSFMRRVRINAMDIGANRAGLPGGFRDGPGDIVHVGGSVKGSKQG